MSSSTQVLSPSVVVDLGSTYGAFFIGAIIAALLFGITNIQAFIYFRTHAGRWTRFYRLVVLLLWILDAVHLVLIVHCVYFYLVINHANFSGLIEVVWSFQLQIVFNVLIVWVIHLLYYHRIWIVGRDRSRAFLIIPGIFVVISSGVAITLIWEVYRPNPPIGLFVTRWTAFMALGVAASLDTLITVSLCYLLATSRTGFSNTDCLIAKLIHYTIDSGCLTSLCSLTSIIACAVMPNNLIFLSVQFVEAKLYVNSYIALLNARYYMQSNTDTANSFELRELHSDSFDIGPQDMSHEKFPTFRRSMFAHPKIEVVSPTRPLQAAMSRRSILVTVEKESFVDF